MPPHVPEYRKNRNKKKRTEQNRIDKRKKDQTKYFEYYYTLSCIYSIYVIMKSRRACAIPFLFSLYVFSGLPLTVCRCYMLRRAVLERLEKEEKEKKRQKILRDAMRCDAIRLSNMETEKEENDFFVSQ